MARIRYDRPYRFESQLRRFDRRSSSGVTGKPVTGRACKIEPVSLKSLYERGELACTSVSGAEGYNCASSRSISPRWSSCARANLPSSLRRTGSSCGLLGERRTRSFVRSLIKLQADRTVNKNSANRFVLLNFPTTETSKW